MRLVRTGLASALLAGLTLLLPALAGARDASEPMGDPGGVATMTVRGDAALELPLRHTEVHAAIAGFVSEVEVTQVFANAQAAPIEATYTFPLPEHAAVEGFTLVAGDRRIEAEVQQRAQARATYDAARRRGNTAALLEQERPNVFTQSVANLPPGEEVRVTLRFSELLAYDAGTYEFVFPLVVGPRFSPGAQAVPDAAKLNPTYLPQGVRSGHDVAITVEVDAGHEVDRIEVPSHDVSTERLAPGRFRVTLADHDHLPNRDFILRYGAAAPRPIATLLAHRTDGDGSFALVLQPPDLDVDALVGKRELVFVVDVSGSMSGLPLWLCQQAARDALSRLRPDDTFNLLTFSGDTGQVFEKPRRATPGNVALALAYVDRMMAGGGTMMLDAIGKALNPEVEAGRRRYVFFMTDGWVGNDAQLVAATHRYVQALAEKRETGRVFSFGVGSAPNRSLLDGIARAGKGASAYASNREDPRRGVDAFFRRIDHPIIEKIEVDWAGLDVKELAPSVVPDLFLSRPLVIHGRYTGTGRATIHVRGQTEDGRAIDLPYAVALPEREASGAVLETLWARAQVEEFDDARAFLARDGQDTRAQEARITELGLAHHLATAFTSFVAVDHARGVGDGAPATVRQPAEVPEDTDATLAGAETAVGSMLGDGSNVGGMLGGVGILGTHGTGAGGGGVGHGSIGLGSGTGKLGVKGNRSSMTVDSDPATVTGALDREAFLRVVRRHDDEIALCYRVALNGDPTLGGRVTLAVTIDATGAVTDVRFASESVHDLALQRCIVARVRRWRFAAGAAPFTVTWPVLLAPPR